MRKGQGGRKRETDYGKGEGNRIAEWVRIVQRREWNRIAEGKRIAKGRE